MIYQPRYLVCGLVILESYTNGCHSGVESNVSALKFQYHSSTVRVYPLRLTSIYYLAVRLVPLRLPYSVDEMDSDPGRDETTPLLQKGGYRPPSKKDTDPGILTRYTIITFKLEVSAFTEA